jgi:hypothetical protein
MLPIERTGRFLRLWDAAGVVCNSYVMPDRVRDMTIVAKPQS